MDRENLLKRYRNIQEVLVQVRQVTPEIDSGISKLIDRSNDLRLKETEFLTDTERSELDVLRKFIPTAIDLKNQLTRLLKEMEKRLDTFPDICPTCHGNKFIFEWDSGVSKKCPNCRGSGNHNSPAQD